MRFFWILLFCFLPFCHADEIGTNYKTTGKYADKPTVESLLGGSSHKEVQGHSHKCPYDGTTWSHTSDSFGNEAAHRCPQCSRLQWTVHEPQVTIRKHCQPAVVKSKAATSLPVFRSNCPNGNCPLLRR